MPYSLARGQTVTWLITFNVDGVAPPLTGAHIRFTVHLGDVTLEKKSTAAGGSDDEIEVVADGQYRVKFVHNDTAALQPQIRHCSSWVKPATGPLAGEDIPAIEYDTFEIKPTVPPVDWAV